MFCIIKYVENKVEKKKSCTSRTTKINKKSGPFSQ